MYICAPSKSVNCRIEKFQLSGYIGLRLYLYGNLGICLSVCFELLLHQQGIRRLSYQFLADLWALA